MSESTSDAIRHQSRRMWTAVIVLLILILANFAFVFASPNSKVQTIVGPIGPVGEPGPQGPPPTKEQIAQAIRSYCNDTSACEGKSPNVADVLVAVSQYCSNGQCKGPAGERGSNAPPVADAQVLSAVVAYCSDGRCIGAKGDTGNTGGTGNPGEDGREIQLRGNNETDVIEWRFVGDEAWMTVTRYCDLTNSCVDTTVGD